MVVRVVVNFAAPERLACSMGTIGLQSPLIMKDFYAFFARYHPLKKCLRELFGGYLPAAAL